MPERPARKSARQTAPRRKPGEDSSFLSMDASRYEQWLDGFLSGRPVTPGVRVFQGDMLSALVHMYHQLPLDKAQEFGHAVARLLETTPISLRKEAIERLYYLVELANVARPAGGKPILLRYLAMPMMHQMRFAGTTLQMSLLNAVCAYKVDDTTIHFIYRHARPEYGFDHLVACLRLLSLSMNARSTYLLLDRLIPLLQADTQAAYLGRELPLIVGRVGCTELLAFCQENEWQLLLRYPEQLERFYQIVRQRVLPAYHVERERLLAAEQPALLLDLHLEGNTLDLTMDQIKAIAAMADREVPRDRVVHLLKRMYGIPSKLDPLLCMWDILDNDNDIPGHGEPGTCQLYARDERLLLRKDRHASIVSVFLEARELYLKSIGLESHPLELVDQQSEFLNMIGRDAVKGRPE